MVSKIFSQKRMHGWGLCSLHVKTLSQLSKSILYNTLNRTIKDTLMIVSANDIKTKGVTLLDKLFEKASEVIINVRGKNKYVVIDIERYKNLRTLELDRLYEETMQEIKEGRYKTQSVEEHLSELRNAL